MTPGCPSVVLWVLFIGWAMIYTLHDGNSAYSRYRVVAEAVSDSEAMQNVSFITDISKTSVFLPSHFEVTNSASSYVARKITHSDAHEITQNGTIADELYTTQMMAVSSAAFPFTEPFLSKRDKCDAQLCEIDKETYVVNTTACADTVTDEPPEDIEVINNSRSYTVRIIVEQKFKDEEFNCWLRLASYTNRYINLTVMRLADEFDGYFDLHLQEFDAPLFDHLIEVTEEDLKAASLSYLSENFVTFAIYSLQQYSTGIVILHVDIKEGTYLRDLPVHMLSNTVGYITSPGFGDSKNYPNNYDGDFYLQIEGSELVVTNLVHLYIHSDNKDECKEDYLIIIRKLSEPDLWCKWKTDIMVRVSRFSLYILFHTDKVHQQSGFNMTFAVLPRSQEPERLPSRLFNCSVPYFHRFKAVFSCTLLRECEDGEDEQDCGQRRNECAMEEAVDAGAKCYIPAVGQRSLTWLDAQKNCSQRGLKLATLGSAEELTQFKTRVPPVVSFNGYYIGAQLQKRLQAVSIVAMYKNIWQWVDGRMVFTVEIDDQNTFGGSCAFYDPWLVKVFAVRCGEKRLSSGFVCEYHKDVKEINVTTLSDTLDSVFIDPARLRWKASVVRCPSSGHVTRDFLSCDSQADCGAPYSVTSCSAQGVTLPMFLCQQSRSSLHYTLVCDHVQHCPDNSDEDFCKYPQCSRTSFRCGNGQCVPTFQQCDEKYDCYDGSDESCLLQSISSKMILPRGAVYFGSNGKFWVNDTEKCPPTHFRCPRGFCMPVYVRCNGVDDCPGREDEAGCLEYTCLSFYRCRGSKTCLHADDVCDGVPQCPEQDDELLCDLVCPDECRCQGLAFVCSASFSASFYPPLRYLDASGSNVTLSGIHDNIQLIALRMSKCRINALPENMNFPNLRELDLSWNDFFRLHMKYFHSLHNLRVLVLAGNPLVQITHSETPGSTERTLEHIDLSHTSLVTFSGSLFSNCSNIKVVNISWSQIRSISEDGFRAMPWLEILDARGCLLTNYPTTLLRYLTHLKTVHSENYKLCCEDMLPINFDLKNCHATQDLIASCDDLLKSNSNRIFLWTFAFLSLVGNVFSIGARLYHQHEGGGTPSSFSVFVTNLSISDFFMGVYLSIIGTADLVYQGSYLWRDDEWRNSAVCKAAGFLCLLSSEASAFIICLITLDRFLVLRFPFGRLHFGRRSAVSACGAVWVMGISLAVIPLLPATAVWEFYSQTGICVPLPFSSSAVFRGHDYSFSVSILLNLVLFLLIAVGQAVIYWAVRSNSMASSTGARARDAAVARRLITVVVSDFLCWFPIGLLGLLAATGTPIPGYIMVAMAIFVLPVNSALNPFLYTFNLLMEKRRKARFEQLLKRLQLENSSRTEVVKKKPRKAVESTDKAAVIHQIHAWIREQLITSEDLVSCRPTSALGDAKE